MELRMVASESFAAFLRERLAPLGPITMRRMFGKTGVFCDGFMLGMVRDNTLYFRVDDGNRAITGFAPPYASSVSSHRRVDVIAAERMQAERRAGDVEVER